MPIIECFVNISEISPENNTFVNATILSNELRIDDIYLRDELLDNNRLARIILYELDSSYFKLDNTNQFKATIDYDIIDNNYVINSVTKEAIPNNNFLGIVGSCPIVITNNSGVLEISLASPEWVELPLTSDWIANFDGRVLQYRKHCDGKVEFRGCVSYNGVEPPQEFILINQTPLPLDCRPNTEIYMPDSVVSSFPYVSVGTDGNMYFTRPNQETYRCLESLYYYVS